MRKLVRLTLPLLAVATVVSFAGALALADDAAIQRRIMAMEAQVQQLRAERDAQVSPTAGAAQAVTETISETLGVDAATLFENGILSKRDEWITIGGEIEMELRDHDWDRRAATLDNQTVIGFDNGWGEFTLDKTRIDVTANFTPDVLGFISWESNEGGLGVVVDRAYFEWNNILSTFGVDDPTNTYVRFGLMWPFDRPTRTQEMYPLIQNAFQREEVVGVEAGGSHTLELDGATVTPYYRFAVINGRQIGDRAANEEPDIFELLQEQRTNFDTNDNKVVGAGGGFVLDVPDLLTLDVLGYGWCGKMPEGDRNTIWGALTEHPWFWYQRGGDFGGFQISQDMIDVRSDDDYSRAGIVGDLRVPVQDLGEFRMLIQGAWAEYGKLRRGGFENTLEFRFDLEGFEHAGRQWFTAITPFYAFSNLQEHGVLSYPTDANTWYRKAHQFGVVVQVTRNIRLKAEWAALEEHVGQLVVPNRTLDIDGNIHPIGFTGSDPENDEFVLQAELLF